MSLSPNQIETWVFDLDNTLYPASSSLFPQIDVRMRRFISERLHLPLDEAFALQKRYYREFGTTLRGLMLVHKMEPDDFLAFVHDIDCTVLDAAPRLDAALARLSGRKLIFTNGTERHALNVLGRLGIAGHFEGIFDIKAAQYLPKPHLDCYQTMLARHAVDPKGALMVEDLHRNLVPAAQLGMTTLWVKEDGHPDSEVLRDDHPADFGHVHHVTHDLVGWLEAAPGD
jgi:putative hydrolase of the HAD superfamily